MDGDHWDGGWSLGKGVYMQHFTIIFVLKLGNYNISLVPGRVKRFRVEFEIRPLNGHTLTHVQQLQVEITQVSLHKRVNASYFKFTVQLFFNVTETRKHFNSIFDRRPSIT